MHHLVVPPVLSGQRVDRHDGRGEQVVAGPTRTIQVGPRVARREVDEPELRIGRRSLPDRAAAVPPYAAVVGPGVGPELTGRRDRVERPHQRPAVSVVRFHPPPLGVLGARKACDDQTIVIEGRTGDHVSVLPPFGLNRPEDLTCVLVERQQFSVQLAYVNPAVSQRDTTTEPSAADRGDGLLEVRFITPKDCAGLYAEGEHIVGPRDHINDSVVHDRLRFARITRTRT